MRSNRLPRTLAPPATYAPPAAPRFAELLIKVVPLSVASPAVASPPPSLIAVLLRNVEVVFTNKQQEINGTVTNERGDPISDFTVLAFATDPQFWRPLSRQIATARPDQNGKFQIRSLPPGDYYLVTVDPAEQGEWFEPAFLDQQRIGAARLLLADGDVKTHDFRISTR